MPYWQNIGYRPWQNGSRAVMSLQKRLMVDTLLRGTLEFGIGQFLMQCFGIYRQAPSLFHTRALVWRTYKMKLNSLMQLFYKMALIPITYQ